MREPIGDSDVVERDLYIVNRSATMLDRLLRSLPLMKEGDAADQRQVLHVVASGPGLAVLERQLAGMGWQRRRV
jgi:hypothetical protein